MNHDTWISGEPFDFQFWWPGDPYDPMDQLANSGVVEVSPPPANPRMEIFPAVEIAWRSETNFVYQVQWAFSLESTDWFNLGAPLAGTGKILSLVATARMGVLADFTEPYPAVIGNSDQNGTNRAKNREDSDSP